MKFFKKEFLNLVSKILIENFIFAFILFMIVVIGYISTFFLSYDNDVEQFSEKVVESITGVQIDLTP